MGWLEGVQEESEFIQPVTQVKRDAAPAGGLVVGRSRGDSAGQGQNGASQPATGGGRPPKQIDPRLAEIYSHERVVVNRNTALRGSKPMVIKASSRTIMRLVTELPNVGLFVRAQTH